MSKGKGILTMSVFTIWRKTCGAALVVACSVGLAACGSNASSSAQSSSGNAGGEVTVRVGTDGAYPPYSYVNDNKELDGFDVAIAKEIDKRLDGYTFEYQQIKWDSLFPSLDAGKIDVIANIITKNSQREQKYLYGETPYVWISYAIAYKQGRTDIKTAKDLFGKKVAAGVSSATTTWLQDYNAKNGNKINIVPTDGTTSKMLQDISNGRVDANVNNPVAIQQIVKELGLDISTVTLLDEDPDPAYLLFAKNDTGRQLEDKIDPIIKQMIKDGTVKKLSEHYLGADYSSVEAIKAAAEAGK